MPSVLAHASLQPPAAASGHATVGRRQERRASLRIIVLVALVLGPLVLYPLARLLLLSVIGEHGPSLAAYRAFFSNHAAQSVLGTTLWIMLASASSASVLGVLLAALLYFRPFPGASLMIRFLELYVAFPSFLVAFTLIFLYGSQGSVSIALQHLFGLEAPPLDFLFGAGGVILAQTVFYTPFVVRPALASFATLDQRLLEAAASLGASGWLLARRVVLPLVWPGIAAGMVLCFLLTLNEFGIMLVLGSAKLITLPIAVYSSASIDLNLPAASAGAVVMLAMSLVLYALYRAMSLRASKGEQSAR